MAATPEQASLWLWLAWIVSWFLASGWSNRTTARPRFGSEALHLLVTMAGFALIFSVHADPADPSHQVFWSERNPYEPIQLWSVEETQAWALFGVEVLGLAFCWWARLHLGRLWSGSVTRKANHRVIDTGPYRLVRHPIYTGLIATASAFAIMKGDSVSLVGAGLAVVGIWIKARLEEGFLRAELGRETYDAYARRTPMLVPRPWPARKSPS